MTEVLIFAGGFIFGIAVRYLVGRIKGEKFGLIRCPLVYHDHENGPLQCDLLYGHGDDHRGFLPTIPDHPEKGGWRVIWPDGNKNSWEDHFK